MDADELAYEQEETASELRWHDSWCIDGYWCPHWDMLHGTGADPCQRDEAPTPGPAGGA